jgi:hypothetical protein
MIFRAGINDHHEDRLGIQRRAVAHVSAEELVMQIGKQMCQFALLALSENLVLVVQFRTTL